MTFDALLLLTAGFFGGALNAIAGGGSFFTFPALLAVGVPPIAANATNTFAACAGYLSGAYALRRELAGHRSRLPGLILISLLGGLLGAGLLLQAGEVLFRQSIPWLLLLATSLFAFGGPLNARLRRRCRHQPRRSTPDRGPLHWLLPVLLLGVCVYGGFFNAGLGIIALSYLILAGETDIHVMNGLKLLISTLVSVAALILFGLHGAIAWGEGGLVLIGTLAGGYVAAHLSRQIPQGWVKGFVIVVGAGITAYFFAETYWIAE
ncbi:sulfite exporter TauE/SafE family protein [Thiohalocapsa marina]|uniref:Probable membrane transporter protein n=1 Tax=Thiohalocapsa marina TaxID=424902 RepID=A0A5M8FVQ0_9GAMM|nr:sulfite exporter TauE/SafE family protein [Thiohalocapsa marina]KAA6187902.1 sulfite exporter TauE/SafE family protein [Thiohalocapsa marina]